MTDPEFDPTNPESDIEGALARVAEQRGERKSALERIAAIDWQSKPHNAQALLEKAVAIAREALGK